MTPKTWTTIVEEIRRRMRIELLKDIKIPGIYAIYWIAAAGIIAIAINSTVGMVLLLVAGLMFFVNVTRYIIKSSKER